MSSARSGGRAAGSAAGTLRRGGTAWPARPPRLRCACRRTAPQPVVPAQAGTQCGVCGGTATRCRTGGVTAGLDRGFWLAPRVVARGDVSPRWRACCASAGVQRARRPGRCGAAERHGRLDRRGCGALAGAPRPSPSYRRRPVPSAAFVAAPRRRCRTGGVTAGLDRGFWFAPRVVARDDVSPR